MSSGWPEATSDANAERLRRQIDDEIVSTIVMRHYNIRGNGMDIGEAVFQLKTGAKVVRKGWNGKNMWLVYASGGTFSISDRIEGNLIQHVVMKTAQDEFVPWLCSQTDLLATDWEVVQ